MVEIGARPGPSRIAQRLVGGFERGARHLGSAHTVGGGNRLRGVGMKVILEALVGLDLLGSLTWPGRGFAP